MSGKGVENNNFQENIVVLKSKKSIEYSEVIPYHPSERYPEYLFIDDISDNKNDIYGNLRDLFHEMGLDNINFNTEIWNPFGDFIQPGNNVLIKPNMVNHIHNLGYTMDCLITHGSVIRCVIDYVIIALKGKGRITIGDAPIQSANFDQLKKINGVEKIVQFYREKLPDLSIEILDFRETFVERNSKGHITGNKKQENVKFKYVVLDEQSFFSNKRNEKFVVADYPEEAMKKYHKENSHKYLVPDRLLDSDVIINLPKPKTHRYSGITGAMKNFIGINSQKQNLPHYTRGSLNISGDEFPKKNIRKYLVGNLSNIITKMGRRGFYYVSLPFFILRKLLLLTLPKNEIHRGTWHGNDTMWRTILDVNRLVLYSDKEGVINNSKQRTVFSLMDAIIVGEKDGPLNPTPYKMNTFIAGFNMFAIDRVLTELMGFKTEYIRTLKNCTKELGALNDNELNIVFNKNKVLLNELPNHNLFPVKGWEIIQKKNASRVN